MATQTFKVPAEIPDSEKFKQKFPGRGPPKQSDFLRKKLSGKAGAKYFDSGDYNVAKANRKKDAIIMTGKQIPTPAALPQRKQSTSRQVTTIGEPPKSPLQKGAPDDEKAETMNESTEIFEEKES